MNNYRVNSSVLDITPEIAQSILNGNTKNRPLNKRTVYYYADQMRKGLWKMNGEPIILSTDGQLLDGQHRLAACVESGIPFRSVVSYNIEASTFDTIDTGRNRTTGDVFAIEGIENANQKASYVTAYINLKMSNAQFENGQSLKSARANKAEALELFKQHKELVEHVHSAVLRCIKKFRLIVGSQLGGYMLYLVLEKNHPIEKVQDFFYQLHQVNKETNSTIGVLRAALVKNLTKQLILTKNMQNIYVVKTWNAFILGKEFSRLQYNREKDDNLRFI